MKQQQTKNFINETKQNQNKFINLLNFSYCVSLVFSTYTTFFIILHHIWDMQPLNNCTSFISTKRCLTLIDNDNLMRLRCVIVNFPAIFKLNQEHYFVLCDAETVLLMYLHVDIPTYVRDTFYFSYSFVL